MCAWEVISHAVAISGAVTDLRTGSALSGARVEITSAPAAFTEWLAMRRMEAGRAWDAMEERPDRRRAAPDGHFHFMDLPDGLYTFTASMPGMGSRYGTAQSVVTVSRDAGGHLDMVTVALAIPPTTLEGVVTAQGGGPLPMAMVQVQGSGERTFSDGDGRYRLIGLETGSRTVTASARGYENRSLTVVLDQAGAAHTADLELARATP